MVINLSEKALSSKRYNRHPQIVSGILSHKIYALVFLALFFATIQSLIYNVQVLLFRIGIVNVTKSGPFIDLSKNIPYLIQGHSFRTQAACSCPSCAMRTFVCNSCISAIFAKLIGYCSCGYSLTIFSKINSPTGLSSLVFL